MGLHENANFSVFRCFLTCSIPCTFLLEKDVIAWIIVVPQKASSVILHYDNLVKLTEVIIYCQFAYPLPELFSTL